MQHHSQSVSSGSSTLVLMALSAGIATSYGCDSGLSSSVSDSGVASSGGRESSSTGGTNEQGGSSAQTGTGGGQQTGGSRVATGGATKGGTGVGGTRVATGGATNRATGVGGTRVATGGATNGATSVGGTRVATGGATNGATGVGGTHVATGGVGNGGTGVGATGFATGGAGKGGTGVGGTSIATGGAGKGGTSNSGAGTATGGALGFISLITSKVSAEATSSTAPYSGVGAYLDGQNRTHVVWSDQAADPSGDVIRYVRFEADGTPGTTVSLSTHYLAAAPAVVVDTAGTVHVTWFVKRSETGSIRSGNYAVYYARSADGSAFVVEQVSTNSTDPTVDTSTAVLGDCYVNDRPQITLLPSGEVAILYVSDLRRNGYAVTVLATRSSAGSWVRQEAFNAGGNLSPDWGFEIPLVLPTQRYAVWIDISDYNPRFETYSGGAWSEQIISGYSGVYRNKHAQIAVLDDGSTYFGWSDEDSFALRVATLNGTLVSAIETVPLPAKQTGNFLPFVMDPVSGAKWIVVQQASGPFYLVRSKNGTTDSMSLERLGVVYGKRSLAVRNGFVSFVTFGTDNGAGYIYLRTGKE